MKKLLYLFVALTLFSACKKKDDNKPANINGTWQLQASKLTEEGKVTETKEEKKQYYQFFEDGRIYLVNLTADDQYSWTSFDEKYTLSGNTLTLSEGKPFDGIKTATINLKSKDELHIHIKFGENEYVWMGKRVDRNLEDDKKNVDNIK